MWLNVIILTLASLSVGFILGWIIARPRRWEYAREEFAVTSRARS
jgi:hypothetical protein